MKKIKKLRNFSLKKIFPILIIIATFFMGIGYAAVNSVITNFSGDLYAKEQNGVFITNVEYLQRDDALAEENAKTIYADGTILNSSITLDQNDSTSEVSLKVSFYNNSNYDYIFKDVFYDKTLIEDMPEIYSNANILYTFTNQEEIISRNGGILDVIITFKYYENTSLTNNVLNSILDFQFSMIHFRWGDYEQVGFDLINIIKSTHNNLEMQLSPVDGVYDRLIIPIDNLEVGSYYTINFSENKILQTGNSYINNSKKYVYGTTVTTYANSQSLSSFGEVFTLDKYFNYDNDPLHTAFMWKEPFLEDNYIEGKTHNISLTFYASEETMIWLWDFSNINNDSTVLFSLSNIELVKLDFPSSSPYARFVDTTFGNWTYNTDYDNDGESEEQNFLKYSYRTTATNNEFDLRVETGIGWEYFNIPIKNLVAGNKYRISFDVNTSPTTLSINTTNVYGAFIYDSKYTNNGNQYITLNSTTDDIFIINKTGHTSGTLEFTATQETMYWSWQCGGINNFQWANINISNVILELI